jgi:predicted dehydrogenase
MNTPKPHTNNGSVPDRRRFLRQGTGAMAGTALAGTLSVAQSANVAPSNHIRLAIVGCGGRGAGAAAQALRAGPDVKLVAICDVDAQVALGARETLGGNFPGQVDIPDERMYFGFDGYRHATADADVVLLATSPGFRPLHFEEAVRQGKHAFMEKPVATCADGVRRVLEAAEEAKRKNLKVAVGMQRRHDPSYVEIANRIHDGAIGDIQYMRVYWNGSSRAGRPRLEDETELQYQIRNWYYFTWLSGDHIVEQHVHNIDIARWWKGEVPVSAQGQGGREVRNRRENGQIFDHHFVEFAYADGSRLFSQCCQIPGHCRRMIEEHAVGTKGTAGADSRHFEITGTKPWKKNLKSRFNAHQEEHYPFFDAIRHDRPHMEAVYGAESTMMAILGRMATYSGKVVTWEDAMRMENKLVPDNLAGFESVPPVLPDADGWYPTAVPGTSEPW